MLTFESNEKKQGGEVEGWGGALKFKNEEERGRKQEAFLGGNTRVLAI